MTPTRPSLYPLIATAMIVAIMLVSFPRTALACSCVPMDDMGARLDGVPAAFVGTLVEVKGGNVPIGGGESVFPILGRESVFRFEVDKWIKGGSPRHVEIHSWIDDGGNCGLFPEYGQTMGVLVHAEGDHLMTSGCSITSPEMLFAGAEGHQPAPGAIPPLLIEGPGSAAGSPLAQVIFLALAGAAVAATVILVRRGASSTASNAETDSPE